MAYWWQPLAGCLRTTSTGCQAGRSCASTLPKWLAWDQASRCSLGGRDGWLAQNDQQGLHCQVWRWVHGFQTLGSVPLLSCHPDAGWQASSGWWLGSLGLQTSHQVLIQTLPMSPLPDWLGRGWS